MPWTGSVNSYMEKGNPVPDPSMVYLWCARLNVLLGGLALVSGRQARAKGVWAALGLCWAAQILALAADAGLSSLSGVAPTFGLAAVVLYTCQVVNLTADRRAGRIRPVLTAALLILLTWGSILPESGRHNSFMTGYVFAVLFFLSRPLSLGATLFALSGMADVLSGKPDPRVLGASKRWAYLAAMIFLGGEIAGCYWGFVGWGTTWRWSGHFYFSAMLFVLYMVALHVPGSFFSSARSRAWGFFVPLAVAAAAAAFSKVMTL